LAHFGDRSNAAPSVACCDVCSPSVAAPASPPAAVRRRDTLDLDAGDVHEGDLDAAILDVVVSAAPPVGRTRAVEILRGGRSKVIAEHAYDRLAAYGAFAHLRSTEVLGRVDQLLEAGTLRSTGGRFPKLRAA
jgi:ATP-dependent DNA helicase RecQ